MRRISISLGLCALLAAGCGGESPEAGRAEPETPAAGAGISDPFPPQQPSEPGQETAPESAASAGSADGSALDLDQVVFTVPADWKSKPANSSILLAVYELPPAEGDQDAGRLTVSTAGGSVADNVQRWRDQFGGNPENAKEEEKEVHGLKATLVDFSGEYKDQRGSFDPGTQRSGYRMLAAIIEVDGTLHFVKAVGPQATIAAHADEFHAFIDSVRKK